jgi:glycolate oxidase iron-sulfur subunit
MHSNVIQTGASRCVACGMCLPHCPTYKKTKSELESPRGRLSLMLALARNELEPSARLESHLSLCLMCRACEAVCPAGVPFAEVMDATRAELRRGRKPSHWQRLGLRVITLMTRPRATAMIARALRIYQKSGLQRLLRATGLLWRLGLADAEAELPVLNKYRALKPFYPAQTERRGAVALFTGCVARIADADTLQSAAYVLTRLGYDVHVPTAQTCCGALHRHTGDASAADALMQTNVQTFADAQYEAIITTASGCAAELLGQRAIAPKVKDISVFLAEIEWPANVRVAPLASKIAVQDPCTLVNVLRAREAPYALLKKIPQADVMPLPGNNQCCGAAGAYHLEQPTMAKRLRDDKVDGLHQLAPDILATSNVGCALHIAAGARAAGREIEIVHPVTLLARQLQKL